MEEEIDLTQELKEEESPIEVLPTPVKPVRQRFVATFPSDITQAEFQARLNALKDPSLPVKAIWWVFVEKGAVSIRIKKA